MPQRPLTPEEIAAGQTSNGACAAVAAVGLPSPAGCLPVPAAPAAPATPTAPAAPVAPAAAAGPAPAAAPPPVVAPDPVIVAISARAQLQLPLPAVTTSPPANVDQVVGIATWLWIDRGQWAPQSATAMIPGLAATVTATPSAMTWTTGTGTTITCAGPGTPYDLHQTAASQHSDCSYTYLDPGAYPVTVTTTWQVAWTASNGAAGTLGVLNRSTTIPLHVVEFQAVTR